MACDITTGALVNSSPAISIVIPSYNTAGLISESLDSIFVQTFTDYEVIVVNDGSPDTTELIEVLEKYRERIVFINEPVNKGLSAARNLGVSHARADSIAFLDSDDIWLPNYLEELYTYLGTGSFDMAYTGCEAFYTATKDRFTSFLGNNPEHGQITRKMMIDGRCHILSSGTLINKAVLLAAGGFDAGLLWNEDFDLWMRLLFAGTRIGYLRKILFRYRLRPGSLTGDSIARHQRQRDTWTLLQAKLDFTTDENRMIEWHKAGADAAGLRAKGRMFIHQKNWPKAREMFASAAKKADELGLPLKHRLKMRLVIILLTLSPRLLLRVFRSIRSDELDHMP